MQIENVKVNDDPIYDNCLQTICHVFIKEDLAVDFATKVY